MARHIFGMAKSALDLRGAKARNLELDFLRLVYAVAHFRERGDEAQGYLLVLSEAAQRRADAWITKYEAPGSVLCCRFDPSDDIRAQLIAEKNLNKQGMVAGTLEGDATKDSRADVGQRIAEDALTREIERREPRVRTTGAKDPPFGVRWDFYGIA